MTDENLNTATAEQPVAETPSQATPVVAEQLWFEKLPDDLKVQDSIKKFKSEADLAKSYLNLEKLASAKFTPAENAPDEVKNEFYKRLGRPDDVNGYEVKLPEKLNADPETINKFKQTFYDAGLSKQQVEKVMSAYGEYAESQFNAVEQQTTAQTQEIMAKFKSEFDGLMTEWGAQKDEKIVAAQRAQKAFGLPKEDIDAIEQAIGPRKVMEMFSKIGQSISPDKIIEGMNNNSYTMSAAEAQLELNRMIKDPEISEAMQSRGNPMHNHWNAERLKLQAIIRNKK